MLLCSHILPDHDISSPICPYMFWYGQFSYQDMYIDIKKLYMHTSDNIRKFFHGERIWRILYYIIINNKYNKKFMNIYNFLACSSGFIYLKAESSVEILVVGAQYCPEWKYVSVSGGSRRTLW